jgi:pimeloyl-ACP methyl ester carboxylesterase
VHVPTLILHRTDDDAFSISDACYLADHISEARYVELAGSDHLPWEGDTDAVVLEIHRFLRSVRDEGQSSSESWRP